MARAARQQGGEFVKFGGGEVHVDQIRGTDDGAHVGIEMGYANAECKSFINLGVHFGFDIGHFGVRDDVGSGEREISVGVEETGGFGLRGDGGPAITGPIGVESKVNAEVGVGMLFGPLCDFGKPRTGNKDAGGSNPVIFEGFFGGSIDGVHHAEIVGVDDEQTGIRGITETWRDGDRIVCRLTCGLLREQRSEGNTDKREESERTKHWASGLVR